MPRHVESVSDTRNEGRSCWEASITAGQSVEQQLAHSHDLGTACGTPYACVVKQILSLVVEPTYLAHVYEATWQNADVEMKRL